MNIMFQPIYWIGCRESEIVDCDHLFAGSITIFGSGKENNKAFDRENGWRYDYNHDNDQWSSFVGEKISKICQSQPDARFMLYDPNDIFSYGNELPNRLLCQNDEMLLDLLNNKHRTRNWLSECVPVLPYLIRKGVDIKYKELCQAFPEFTEFVLQEVYSCGGSGTHFISSAQELKKYLADEKTYSLSPYLKNSFSPNIHMIIYDNEVILLPPSIQLFSSGAKKFHYQGADFTLSKHLPKDIFRKITDVAKCIGERLRFAGYRGICGVDFLVCNNELYFMEINARFQSSTFLINKALKGAGKNCSMQALHLDAFSHATCSFDIQGLSIPYSFWGYSYDPKLRNQLHYIYKLHKSTDNDIQCVDDNLDWNMKLDSKTYLFKSVFQGGIASISPESQCRVRSNINLDLIYNQINTYSSENAYMWKIMLLNHGVRISTRAIKRSLDNGGLNFEEFEAVDMVINKQIYVSVPYKTKFSYLSPFEVDISESGQYELLFWDNPLAHITLRYNDPTAMCRTKSGIPYGDIAYLGNDRLRVYHRTGCFFKDNKIGCTFCDIESNEISFTFDDMKEVVDTYKSAQGIRHYLIGGGSACPDSDFSGIIQLATYIKDTTHKPIYLMSLPPKKTSILAKLKEAGITEVAFNLELFDRKLAQTYMPGKGQIPLDTYKMAFEEATRLWGKNGNVRTIFIVGLEPKESLLSGIEWACKLGVSPILSLFKPIEGTELSYLLPPSDAEIMDIYVSAINICNKYGIELGPSCHYCEDNTLKVSLK